MIRTRPAENVQVLLRDGGGCYLTSLSQVNGEDYKLTGLCRWPLPRS